MNFRSFRARLLTFILALVGLSQLATLVIVARANRRLVGDSIAREIEIAATQFQNAVRDQTNALARGAAAVSFDTGLMEALTTDGVATATLQSALSSFQLRFDAGLVALLRTDGTLAAETREGPSAEAAYRPLFERADAAVPPRATGYCLIDGQLFSVTVVALRPPAVVGWLAIGFPIDRDYLGRLRDATGVEITLRHGDRTLATTVAAPEEFVSAERVLPIAGGEPARLVLQHSETEKLRPARELHTVLAIVGSLSLAVAAVLALAIAREISRPVQALAAHTRVIAAGDYGTRLDLGRVDEIGQLADSFNAMSAGLAERDRVRDLLDKNVSPEVAAQLMRDGAALGGEEREVTILFSDLRGFTTLSERRSPREVLALLNRYLDRMSAAIESEGGVIDKFIGDEIMALFGAPVGQPDAADRALRSALAMAAALESFNRELAAENQPPLAAGIGINTARVVAGNIGSHRRLNYSVIGDGVNVAARLQTLTRKPEFAANIIVSDATRRAAGGAFRFRPLGSVTVKGRDEAVAVWALG